MKTIFVLALLTFSSVVFAQTEIADNYKKANSLLQNNNFLDAYKMFKEVEAKCDVKDTLYNYILWYYIASATQLEKSYRDKEVFDSSLHYGLETLKLIEKGKSYFDEKFVAREFWMIKNLIVSYFGLEQFDNAKKMRDVLYAAYKEKKLPEGIDTYFNFSFFKWEDKNVWGYEWFEELPDNRMSKSFSKIVYYVYSRNADGTDKDQLYRLHVLMFHKADESVKFDYVLTKRLEAAKNEPSGTLYDYTYNKEIEYKKLQLDIKEVLKGNYQPKSK